MGKENLNCLIFHGTDGHDQENWFPWLKEELEKMGIETQTPNFPDSKQPDLEKWLEHLSKYKINQNTILIGHSLGAVLILRLLEKGVKIKAGFLVAAFANDLGWEVLKRSHFFDNQFDWEKIKFNCNHFEVFTSKNDPHLKISDGDFVADNLGVENQILDVDRHFNMKEFSLLLEKIRGL